MHTLFRALSATVFAAFIVLVPLELWLRSQAEAAPSKGARSDGGFSPSFMPASKSMGGRSLYEPSQRTEARPDAGATPETPYKARVRKTVHENASEVRACYEYALRHSPNLNGKVVVEMRIANDGTVDAVKVVESTLGSTEVSDCVTARIWKWVFPKPNARAGVVVSYPFIFEVPRSGTRPDAG